MGPDIIQPLRALNGYFLDNFHVREFPNFIYIPYYFFPCNLNPNAEMLR